MKYVSSLLNVVIAASIVAVGITSNSVAQGETAPPSEIQTKYTQQDFECMALNIYWEARNQSRMGMIAVGRVVLNRQNDSRFPNTVCGVVKQGPVKESWKTRGKDVPDAERKYVPVRHMCQFSWYCDGKKDDIPEADKLHTWVLANEIAYDLLFEGRYVGTTDGATHYHANYVSPSWRTTLHYVTRVDSHLFYRWD